MADYMKDFWEREWTNNPAGPRSTSYIRIQVEGKRVLDVGCGDLFYCSLPEEAGYFCGVDISRVALCSAKEKYPNAHFIQASAQQLPFPDCSFDLVTSMDTITILGRSFYKALEEMIRVSRSRLFFILSHRESNFVPDKYKYTQLDCATMVEDSGIEKVIFTEDDVMEIARRLKLRPTITVLTWGDVFSPSPLYCMDSYEEDWDKKSTILVEAEKI